MVQNEVGIAQPKGYVEQPQERIKCLKAVAQDRGLPVEGLSTQPHPSVAPLQLSLSLQAPPLAIIHSLLLFVVFSLHSPAAVSSWHLIGIAVKKCIALRFHRETGKPAGAAADRTGSWRRGGGRFGPVICWIGA
jgi:hypothetical protein